MVREVDLNGLEHLLWAALTRVSNAASEAASGLERFLMQAAPGATVARRKQHAIAGRRAIVRSFGGIVGNLVDAYLLLRLLGWTAQSTRTYYAAVWQPFVEATLSGAILPTPAMPGGGSAEGSPPLAVLQASMRDYFCVGVFWCERTGIPRRWLIEAYPRDAVRAGLYIAFRMRGFKPVFATHIPSLPPGVHLTEAAFVQAHVEIAHALRRAPDVLGVASSSWFYDPVLPRVSPHLEFVDRILRGNGCLRFEIRSSADMRADALSASRSRRDQLALGGYAPRTFARLWSRRGLVSWADRQAAPLGSLT